MDSITDKDLGKLVKQNYKLIPVGEDQMFMQTRDHVFRLFAVDGGVAVSALSAEGGEKLYVEEVGSEFGKVVVIRRRDESRTLQP